MMKLVIVEIGGSSPLARGPLVRRRRQLRGCGLIPARAGTTGDGGDVSAAGGAHPRSRGDHVTTVKIKTGAPGSSPLARGPRAHVGCEVDGAGLIPARAGTTAGLGHTKVSVWAHPRSRGDHRILRIFQHALMGSSPLARGPPRNAQAPQEQPGLIPARAGTTGGDLHVDALAGAHPRSRGDHPNSTRGAENLTGSSPLARGPPVNSSAHRSERGLIPARAGTTLVKKFFLTCAGAHPRSRGDHRIAV